MNRKLYFLKQMMHIIVAAIDIYILVYLLKMQKSSYGCKCAQVQYLKEITNTIIIITSLKLVLIILFKSINPKDEPKLLTVFIAILSIALLIAQIYYVIMLIKLLIKLHNINCLCIDHIFKIFLSSYTGIIGFTTAIIIILFIISFFKPHYIE